MIHNISQKMREEVQSIPTEEYAPDEKPENIIADLSLNINPFGVSKKVMERLKEINVVQVFRYYPENKTLVHRIAEYMHVPPENVLIGDGCDGCLNLIAKTFITKNDTVIIPTPTFHRYEFHTRLMGGNPRFIPMKDFSLDADAVLREAQRNNAKLIFLCNPNNPTGVEIDKKEKIKLIENFPGIVVVDEALADITSVNGSLLVNKYNNLIVVRSFSKSFGLASLRIGYLITTSEIISLLRKVSSPFKVNGIAQELAIEALQDKEHIKESIKYLHEEREFIIKELENCHFPCTASTTTNFLVKVEQLGSVEEVIQKLKQRGVLVTPAVFFRVEENKYIRVAVSSKEENRYFIKTLKEIKNAMMKA